MSGNVMMFEQQREGYDDIAITYEKDTRKTRKYIKTTR